MENIIVAAFSYFSFPEASSFMLLARSNLDRLSAVERENCVRYWYSYTKYVLTLAHVSLPVAFFSLLIRLSSVK